MMTPMSRFTVREQVLHTATRPNGASAREKLRERLLASPVLVVDFDGVLLTPSFADEFLGVLLAELGDAEFRRTVRIENLSPSSQALLQVVLRRRRSKPRPDSKFAHEQAIA